MKTKKPNTADISKNIRNMVTIDLPDGELDDVIDKVSDLCSQSYDAGYNLGIVDGALKYESDNSPINEEKSNTEFVTEQFAECENFEQFKSIYNEIRNRSYNFM